MSTDETATLTTAPSQARALPRFVLPLFLMVGSLLIGAAFAMDQPVETYARSASERVHWLAGRISHWMDWPEVVGVPLLFSLAFALTKRRDAARQALAITLAAAIAGLSGTVVRTATGRTRPSTTVVQGWYGMRHDGQWIVGQHAYSSFPSGHTSTVAGAAGGIFAIRRRWGWLSFGAICLVAWARLFAVAHHLSDVTAATVLGLGLGYWIASKILKRRTVAAQ